MNRVTHIRKRDGTVVLFDDNRISNAIYKALVATKRGDFSDAQKLGNLVVEKLNSNGWEVPTVEQIQDVVEKILIEHSSPEVAKAYIVYRKEKQDLRNLREAFMNVESVMDGYLEQSDWRVNENSNINYSIGGLILHAAGSVIANYSLTKVYPEKLAFAHKRGEFHIHDLSMGIVPYCAGWSLRQLITDGFNGVPGKINSVPARHLNSLTWQIINFIGSLQNEWAGAQSFSSFDTYLAPFIKADKAPEKEIKQAIQGFVFNMNVPTRWGSQTPFSNITLDWKCPDDMKDLPAVVGGKEQSFTYGDCQKEMDLINGIFLEMMTKGDADGRIFTYPIPTYNLTNDFDWKGPNTEQLFKLTAKYGLPYFANFVNSDMKPSDVRSMCCRLRLDKRELRSKGGGLFGAGELTGSLGVVTINMPRLGYLAKDESEFFDKLGEVMDLAKEALEIKRKVVIRNMERGLMPYSKRYLGSFSNHFSTIGLNGMNEACLNLLKESIATDNGRALALKTLDYMRNRIADFQAETGNLYNLEATPAEGTSYRFAKIDKKVYPKIITAGGNGAPYYTNSTQLPVGLTDDIFEALQHQDELQCKYTGGTVFHGFVGEKISSWEACRELVKKIAYNFKLPYYTITPTFSICPVHGYVAGEHRYCPAII